jgi:MSHA pilin protein MshC
MVKIRLNSSGFTLVELVVVLIVVGILAFTALPRFFDQEDFYARGFYDETLAALRYAQKTAVAQRRPVCVSFGASSVALNIATHFAGACDKDLAGPNGTTPYAVSAKGAVQYSPVPANLSFSPEGAASAAQTIAISGFASTIQVEKATGYVH